MGRNLINYKKWLFKNKIKHKTQGLIYYKMNRNRILIRQRKASQERRIRIRNEIFDLLGGRKCSQCDWTDTRALQIDHIKGGGSKDRRKITDGGKYLEYIKSHLNKFQILCANHNWIKRFTNNEFKPFFRKKYIARKKVFT